MVGSTETVVCSFSKINKYVIFAGLSVYYFETLIIIIFFFLLWDFGLYFWIDDLKSVQWVFSMIDCLTKTLLEHFLIPKEWKSRTRTEHKHEWRIHYATCSTGHILKCIETTSCVFLHPNLNHIIYNYCLSEQKCPLCLSSNSEARGGRIFLNFLHNNLPIRKIVREIRSKNASKSSFSHLLTRLFRMQICMECAKNCEK